MGFFFHHVILVKARVSLSVAAGTSHLLILYYKHAILMCCNRNVIMAESTAQAAGP